MGFFKGDTGSIKLGETHVLPGVLGHEIRRAAGTTGRVDIHAIAWDFLEQFELPRRQLARMLCHIVRVDVVEGLITLELPVLPSYLAVTPSCPLLPWLCPGWNIAARTGGALAPSGVNFEPSASAPWGAACTEQIAVEAARVTSSCLKIRRADTTLSDRAVTCFIGGSSNEGLGPAARPFGWKDRRLLHPDQAT